MEYDVTGTLKIDTESFEQALKDAQEKINKFRKDLNSIKSIAKDLGFENLGGSLEDIDKLLENIKGDFGKVDKSADNVTKSVDNLKKKTDGATKSAENLKKTTNDVATQGKKAEETIKTLDEYFDQATSSAKELTAEVKKSNVEVNALKKKMDRLKLDKNFTKDFYKLVSQAEGTGGVELKPIYNQLKSKYKQYLKGKAEFERLFTNAVQRTNTRLYPTRDPDKHVNVSGRNFGYIDRKKLISVDEFSAKLDKVDAKIEKINAELNKPAEGLNTTASTLDKSFDQATSSAKKLTAESKKISNSFGVSIKDRVTEATEELNRLKSNIQSLKDAGAGDVAIQKATNEYEKQKKIVQELTEATNKSKVSAENGANAISESFDRATNSVKKLTAEAKKVNTEVDKSLLSRMKIIDRQLNTLKNTEGRYRKEYAEKLSKYENNYNKINELGYRSRYARKDPFEIHDLELENHGLKKELDELSYKISEVTKKSSQLKNEFNELGSSNENISNIGTSMEFLRQKGERLQKTLLRLKREYGSLMHSGNTKIARYQHEQTDYAEYKEGYKDIEKAKQLKEQYSQIYHELQQLGKEYDELASKSGKSGEKFNVPLEHMGEEIGKSTIKVRELEKELGKLNGKSIEKLSKDLSHFAYDLSYGKREMERNYASSKNENYNIVRGNKVVGAEPKSNRDLNSDVKSWRKQAKEVDNLKVKVSALISKIFEYENTVQNINTKAHSLTDLFRGNQTSNRMSFLQSEISDLKRYGAELEKSYNSQLQRFERLRNEHEQAIEKYDSYEGDKRRSYPKYLKKQISETYEKMTDSKADLNQLSKEIDFTNEKLLKFKNELHLLSSDNSLEGLINQFNALKSRIKELDKGRTTILGYYPEEEVMKMQEELGRIFEQITEKVANSSLEVRDVIKSALGVTFDEVVETTSKIEEKFMYSFDHISSQAEGVSQKLNNAFRSLGQYGKWFPQQKYLPQTNRWVHEQLSTTRDFFKGFTQGFARLKKEQSESVTWMNELQVKMNELKYSSRDFINTEVFAKAKVEAEKYMATLDKMRRRLGLIEKYQYQPTGNKVGVGFAGSSEYQQAVEGLKKMEMQANKTAEAYARLKAQYKPEFNQFSAGFLGDANIQKDIQLVNEFNRVTREVSASTNQWVNQEITDFNRFSQAVQKSITKTREEMQLLNSSFKKAGNMSGVGFAGTNQFQAINKGMQEYNRLSNLANLNTNRMGLGFEKFGQYSKKAESNVRSLGGVLRTLRTTMSMIGGMFVWEFAFKIMDATKATISAKSEMESYYKTLNMGSTEIASFNNMLDKTVNKFQKMNKFQLGETISALGVEFKMSTDEMNQVMKVAPMIVNEYLRAGRSTEEAILAIKDISQGEFLRLSRETGVGAKEIKEAGWSGDNKDIISLYKALEKIGTARHWDVFAQKAQSLNDVMLITENRMTEFATLVSDAITPVIVGSFNALGDAFNSASRWYEGLPVADKIWVQIATLGTVGLTTAGVFNSHLLPAIQNFGMNLVSSFLGVDSAVAKEKGLAQAIAHETAVERIANIERTNGQRVLHAKIMTLKEEELANKLGMSTTKLKTRYEALQSVAYRRTGDSLKAKELAQRSLIMAEEQNITTTQAMNILLEEEALAEMGTFKALIVRKLGLDANTVSEQGMVVALNERLAQSFPYITSLVSETFATLGLESATATLVATLGLLIAPLIAIGVALAPLIIQFAELQGSYEKVADTLTAGQDRIDSYKEKQKSLQKTVDELSAKNNRTVDEEKKLESSRKKLTNTTTALKRAEEELKYARQVEGGYSEWSDQLEANRYNNAKKINEEYQKQTGLSEEVTDSTYGMSKAYKDMTEHMQTANWLENHRNDRFAELSNNLKNTTSSQEEYNQKLKQFGKDWNQVYDDMEDAQMRMADPNADTWGRLMATLDYDMALAKKDWIEFWSDPLGSIAYMTNFDGLSQGFNNTLTDMGQAWDDFWKPVSDFFNGLSVDGDFDPFAGLKQSWGDANAWLDSLLPDISVDSIKQWFGKNVREPLQQAISDFMKNPFGGDSNGASGGAKGGAKGGASPSKSFDLKSIFKFDFPSLRTSFTNGFRTVFNKVPNVMQTAGKLWSSISKNNGLKSVNSLKDGLSAVKTTVSDKFHQGANTIRGFIGTFKSHASSVGKGVHNSMKTGVGDLASNIRSKLNAMKKAIDGMKERIVSSAKSIASGITGAFDGISLPSFGFGGFYGFRGTRRSSPSRTRIRGRHAHVYGSPTSNMSFETALKGMLTAQGFRRPSSYQFYPNSRKSTQQTWADGTANCFDGAKLIVALGKMFGLKSHIVTGNWNGMGHAGAVVGGKLYDMTQFQRKGVFRGTSGVHFGSRSHGASYGNTKNETNKTVNLYVTNDLSNARIYGIDDLDAHIKRTSEKTYYELHSPNSAIGY